MKIKKSLLWLNAAVWLFFGIGYAVAPSFFASLVDASITKADSYKIMTDVGIMMVGISIWYVYCVLDDTRIQHGVISAFLICFGMLVGRVIGTVVAGSANNITILYIILETLDSALLLFALRAKERSA